MSCTKESEKRKVIRADLERNVSLCLHNIFWQKREQRVIVDLLLCCKQRLLQQGSWDTARSSVRMLKKVLEDSEMGEQEDKAWNESWRRRDGDRSGKK